MEKENLMVQMKSCAIFLYQNREREAYEKLGALFPLLNELLQNQDPMNIEDELMRAVARLIDAYQKKDHLLMADLLYDVIPQKI